MEFLEVAFKHFIVDDINSTFQLTYRLTSLTKSDVLRQAAKNRCIQNVKRETAKSVQSAKENA